MASTVGAASRSWLPENIGLMPKIIVTPVTIYQPALSGLPKWFSRPASIRLSPFSHGHPDLKVAEVTAIGGTRATGWSPVSRSACSRYFRVFDQAQPA